MHCEIVEIVTCYGEQLTIGTCHICGASGVQLDGNGSSGGFKRGRASLLPTLVLLQLIDSRILLPHLISPRIVSRHIGSLHTHTHIRKEKKSYLALPLLLGERKEEELWNRKPQN
ncbi:hypothetical protein BDZ91DRAFT_768327 [Kalaharituber pfeilii]|nr:hypothetical protein BDZ91DRAFT_768327 [Kalaharituber pfeilii]